LSDYTSAYALAAAVVAALSERERSGRGRRLQTSLAAAATMAQSLRLYDLPDRPALRRRAAPTWRLIECSDGWVFAQCPGARLLDDFAREHGRGGFLQLAPHAAGNDHTKWRASVDCRSLLATLAAADIPAVRVARTGDLYEDPEIRAAGLVRTAADRNFGIVDRVGAAYYTTWRNETEDEAVPLPGEHSSELLKELGFGSSEVRDLIRKQVVQQA
jgi:crotonobetainyl-CoA:carnitine CoA-transferase CaiB-like acyl-CoA transferase